MGENKKVEFYAYGLKDIAGKDFMIERVFPIPYRKIFNETTKRSTEYFQFPADAREVIQGGDKDISDRKDEPKTEWRRKVWNESTNRPEFHKFKPESDFKKVSMKVFDVDVRFNGKTMLNKGSKKDVGEFLTARVPVSGGHIQQLLNTYAAEFADNLPKTPGKNRNGEPVMYLPFDWEDKLVDKLHGLFINVKIESAGGRSKYFFRPAKPFEVKKEDEFGSDFGAAPKESDNSVPF